MKDKIFKKDDRVFCFIYGWGKIIAVDHGSYPITVQFDNYRIITYNSNGGFDANSNPSLSFTEYKLYGFSQERSNILPKKGDIVWVRDLQNSKWVISHFIEKIGGQFFTSDCASKNDYLTSWNYMTTENPYIK